MKKQQILVSELKQILDAMRDDAEFTSAEQLWETVLEYYSMMFGNN